MRVGVVGAGIGGLAVAIRLAAKGHSLSVFEANKQAGGKMSELQMEGYRFDTGPSLFTMPEEVDALFRCCGEKMSDHLGYHNLEVLCHYFYPKGACIRMPAGEKAAAISLAQQTGEPLAHLSRFMRRSRRSYRYLSPLFLSGSPRSWRTYFSSAALSAYLRLPCLGLGGSLHAHNAKLFENPQLVQLFDRYATYCGSSPYQVGALYRLIPYVETAIGSYLPEGGMYAVVRALVALAKRQGVQFHFNTTVEQILIKGNKTTGLRTTKGEIATDALISNADVENTYLRLLKMQAQSVPASERSSAGLIFYWGIRKQHSELGLHNIFFSANYKEEFTYIFEQHKPQPDPTVYVNISSKICTKDAPKGCENWFVMLNVSSDPKIRWSDHLPSLRKQVLEKLSLRLGKKIEPLIECESVLTPELLANKTVAASGALYGRNAHRPLRAVFRHPNRHPSIKGLFFCGGTVHPGGGIPLCLHSAKQVAAHFQETSTKKAKTSKKQHTS